MYPLRKFLIVIIILCTAFQAKMQAHAEDISLFRVSDRTIVSYEEMIRDVREANLIFVGELHDNESHHKSQLDLITGLNRLKIPIAVGLEMFAAKSQNELDRWVNGDISIDNFIKAYYKNWNVPWVFNNAIFLYLRNNKIPAIGLNIPKEVSEKIDRFGFSSLSIKEVEEYFPRVVCNVEEKYLDYIKRAYRAHENSKMQFSHFCEAQLLRDKTMAWNITEFLRKNPSKTIIVFMGASHAWKRGVPEQTRNLFKELRYRVILPRLPGNIEPDNITTEDADYILLR